MADPTVNVNGAWWIPSTGCEGQNGNSLYYGTDLEAAKKCQAALEETNPKKVFKIIDGAGNNPCYGDPPPSDCGDPMYYIEEGLSGSCKEMIGGEFDDWSSSLNEARAKECANDLNRIEAAKGSGLECRAKNIGGTFVDNWEVTCGKAASTQAK